MKKPIIGLVGRVVQDKDQDTVIGTFDHVRLAIVKKGGIPFVIIPTQEVNYDCDPLETSRLSNQERTDLEKMVDLCDGIVFPGGYEWYEYDEIIYQYARNQEKPILGICLGMQMMSKMDVLSTPIIDNTIKNETTVQQHNKEKQYVHPVKVVENTKLRSIIKEETIQVNSRHNYHVEGTNHLIVSAYSSDGVIEAVEDPSHKFVIGVQWHPEDMLDYDESANLLIEAFIKSASY